MSILEDINEGQVEQGLPPVDFEEDDEDFEDDDDEEDEY